MTSLGYLWDDLLPLYEKIQKVSRLKSRSFGALVASDVVISVKSFLTETTMSLVARTP